MTISLQDHRVIPLTDLVFTVASDDNASNHIDADEFGKFEAITIGTRESTLTGTITVAVLLDPDLDETADASWVTLQSGGVDIEISAGKAVTITPPACLALRLESSGSEGADRTFEVVGRLQRVASA